MLCAEEGRGAESRELLWVSRWKIVETLFGERRKNGRPETELVRHGREGGGSRSVKTERDEEAAAPLKGSQEVVLIANRPC